MGTERRKRGDETWNRLLSWTEAQKASERLAGHILAIDGFMSIDPSHPLGGPDGLKDIICARDGVRWVASAYFPNGQQSFKEIKSKYEYDIRGVATNSVQGFAFVTNQYLKLSEREELTALTSINHLELYHLERIARILDTPVNYGIRLEFLDIEMTREEQLAFFGTVIQVMNDFRSQAKEILEALGDTNVSENVPTKELAEFKAMLQTLVGYTPIRDPSAPMSKLNVPLTELREFASTVHGLVGYGVIGDPFAPVSRLKVPLKELRQFADLLRELVGVMSNDTFAPVSRLKVPLDELREYERTLDRILSKLERLRLLNSRQ
jgi:hypothetical protein